MRPLKAENEEIAEVAIAVPEKTLKEGTPRMPHRRQPIHLAYARALPRDWVERWPWIITTATLLVLLFAVSSFLLFVWFLLNGPPR